MTTTPRGATELVSGQAVPETTVNEQVRHTEAGACHFIVADNDLTAPPGACADGASYIIAATATGAWAGKEKQIATALGTNAASGWTYHVPAEGYTAYIQDENARFLYDGSDWVPDASGTVTTASATEVLTGTDAAKAVTPDSLAALWEQGADVASAGTISLGEGGYFNITGTTTITDIDFATDKAGRKAWVKFAGALTLTNGANLILPTGANITTAAGDTACFISEGSDVVRCVAYQRASGEALAGSAGTLDSLTDVVITGAAQGDVIYYNGTNFVNLGPGTSGHFLKTQGAGANPVWAAASGSGNAWLLQGGPLDNQPPASNYATLDTRNSHPVLDFDATTQEAAIWTRTMPFDYSGAGVTVYIWVSLTSATSGTVGFDVAFERMDASSLDIDADSFATAQTVTAVTVPGTSGQLLRLSLNISNGANMDSVAAGEMFRLRIRRDVANDTATGDAELLRWAMVSQ